MDRRVFLRSSGLATAAAASGAAAGASVATAELAASGARGAATDGREFILAVPQSLAHIEVMTAAHRLAARLQTAFAGARYVTVTTTTASGLETIQTGAADAYLGLDTQHAAYHPAFALLAGAPLGEHLDGPAHHAWLTTNRDIWDDLATAHGAIAFPAFHTGPSAGLYTERLLETAADLKGARMGARGLAATMLTQLGALPEHAADTDLTAAIASGSLVAAEPLMAPTSAVAHWAYQPGLTPGGYMLSLGLRTSFWATLQPSERAAIEGIAATTYLEAQANAHMLQLTVHRLNAHRRWPLSTVFPSQLQRDLEQAASASLDNLANHDTTSRRLVASLRAFRGGFADPSFTGLV
jgi:TRAP-type mannitol/chloroaromatic compound transport system substrate-binding protein